MREHAPWTVRPGTAADADTLIAFNCAMAWETEQKRLDQDTVSAGVRHLLATPDAGFYLVAMSEAGAVGSLMITTEWSDWRNGTFWWIQSVYVQPDARRRGVYRAMYEQVKTLAATQDDLCGFRLYVERENRDARATYAALGMDETTYRLYEASA